MSEPGVLSLIYDPVDQRGKSPDWLFRFDEIASRYAEACAAHDVIAIDARHADPWDDGVEDFAEQISDECHAILEEMMVRTARVLDGEIASAFLETDGTGPRAEALCVVMKRRHIDF